MKSNLTTENTEKDIVFCLGKEKELGIDLCDLCVLCGELITLNAQRLTRKRSGYCMKALENDLFALYDMLLIGEMTI